MVFSMSYDLGTGEEDGTRKDTNDGAHQAK